MDCTIRSMRGDEVERIAIEFAAREGWNPGLHDGACFQAADPGGFLLAECEGQPAGCISAVSYGGHFGFIGLFIVAPPWRGRGLGRRLWDAGMARLDGHVVGLDGVPAQQDYYRRNGFELAWQNSRFAGIARPAAGTRPSTIVSLGSVDPAMLSDDDQRCFPAPRDAFLQRWVAMPGATGLAWMEHGRLAGWGVIRRCRQGHKIGPLNADDAAIASALYTALCNSVPAGDTVFLDVPLPHAEAVALAKAHKLQSVFQTARMYAGNPPSFELRRVYGITSFELG